MTSPEKFTFPQESEEKHATEQPQEEFKKENRNLFEFQEREPFDNKIDHLDACDEIRLPTEEEQKNMNDDLKEFNQIFAGSDLRYYIDGGLIISMMRGEYIRVHKDIDISVARGDLEKLDKLLANKNYGLFRIYPKDPNSPKSVMVFERMSEKKLQNEEIEFLMIANINEQGKISDTKKLNFMDVHCIETEDMPKGFSGVSLPQEWFRPREVIFQGEQFKIAHPAILTYIKLHRKRPYDQTDLQFLAETGKLTLDNVDEIESVLDQEFENRKVAVSNIIDKVSPSITGESGPEEIFDALTRDKDMAGRIKKEGDKQRVRKLSELIAEQDDKSPENIKRVVIEAAGIEAEITEQRGRLQTLRQRVSDVEERKEIKDNLGK